jgi:hypothetical protein
VKVIKRFVERNADLFTLSKHVEYFFKAQNFKTTKIQTYEGFIIKVEKSLQEKIYVKVTGEPNNFTVELSTERSSDIFIRLGILTSLFGGGGFFLKGVKSRDMLLRVESDFWRCIEEVL